MAPDFRTGSVEYIISNSVSVLSSLAIIVYVLYLKFKRPAYLDRVSLMIQVAVALVDIVRHISFILCGYTLNDTTCAFQGFLYIFCFHAITFLNFTIALNLQIIYLHEIIPSENLGKFLYIVPIITALVIDLIPLTMNAYGRGTDNFCVLKSNYPYLETLKMILLYMTNYPLLLYCFIIPLLLMIKLFITRYIFKPFEDPELQPLLRPMQDPLSRTLGLKVAFYPLACSLCHLGEVLLTISISLKYSSQPILFWANFGLSINGTVNFICFILDPYIQESWSPPTLELSNESSERDNSQNGSQPCNRGSANYKYKSYSDSTSDLPVSNQSSSLSGTTNTDPNSNVDIKAKSEKSTKLKKQVRFDLDRTRYYIAPIPIPGARSPDEYKRENWHTTDLHLDVRKQYRLR